MSKAWAEKNNAVDIKAKDRKTYSHRNAMGAGRSCSRNGCPTEDRVRCQTGWWNAGKAEQRPRSDPYFTHQVEATHIAALLSS